MSVTMGNETQLEVSGKARTVREVHADWLLGPGGRMPSPVQYWVDANQMLVRCMAADFDVFLDRFSFRR